MSPGNASSTTRPAIAYWGDSWFTTPLYRNLNWHSFSRIEGISIRLGKPGYLAAEMCTRSLTRNYADRLTSPIPSYRMVLRMMRERGPTRRIVADDAPRDFLESAAGRVGEAVDYV